MNVYLFCTLPRSGSNLFCDGLGAGGISGDPDEWFGPSRLHDRLVSWGLEHSESTTRAPRPISWKSYLKHLILRTSTAATFGIKLHWHHIEFFNHSSERDDLIALISEIAQINPVQIRCLYHYREDVVAQAVSASIASQTGVYFQRKDNFQAAEQSLSNVSQIHYDFDNILTHVRKLEDAHIHWMNWIKYHDLKYRSYTYNQLISDWHGTTA